MPVNDRIATAQPEFAEWRHALHRKPELLYEVHETAAFVADKLRAFGCDTVETGIGRTGVVGVVHGRSGSGGPMIGLRADMDALPIVEATDRPYASQTPGTMHACGHDGHMTMLLAAARTLCEERAFEGSVALIFQPAEEGGAGGRAMVEDGLFSRFPCERVFGMHNLPGLPVGRFGMRPGPVMASVDLFTVTLTGSGGHAALPHRTIDPIVTAAATIQALQSVVSRNANPLDAVVLSVTEIAGGSANNVIPDTVTFGGTVRCLSESARDVTEERIRAIVDGVAAAHGASATIDYLRHYPVTDNTPGESDFCAEVAVSVAGAEAVDPAAPPLMAGEDFAFMLDAVPGAYIFLGNGDSASLHNARYDFDDAAIVYGASYWVALAERALGRNEGPGAGA